MIDIKNLHLTLQGNAILKDIDLHIAKGETICIIGPSGSGKSTLLRSMNFMQEPTSGSIQIDSTRLNSKTAPEIRKTTGMVFQHFHLFPHMSVLENITYAPINVLKLSKAKAESEALALLEQVGLKEKAHSYPNQLSGGQKQRAAIARALAMHPEILLFDEPTSALDPEMVKEVLEVIQSLAHKGITMVIVTHEMKFAKSTADRILFLSEGNIIEDSEPKAFFNEPKTKRAQSFLDKVL